MFFFTTSTLLLCLLKYEFTTAHKLPGPPVYVVTPSPRTLTIDEGRSAPRPFYYQNWIRRMDSPVNMTTTSTTTPRVKTPDLIFAEFESNKLKNIRKLLEKERIDPKTSTTAKPIYVPDDITYEESQNYGLPAPTTEREDMETSVKDMTDYFALYNNMHNSEHKIAPVYVPSSTSSTQEPTTTASSETSTAINNVENIWHIIDNEKRNQYYGTWNEEPISINHDQNIKQDMRPEDNHQETLKQTEDGRADQIDDNFALPGFSTNPVKGADNESRAIRTETNMHYPYVNLQPFQMKNMKNPLRNTNGKKGNNMYTNLDNFYNLKSPVRGEAQDVVYLQAPVERYNPAQPYLPSTHGSKSKQSNPNSKPAKAVANLVPPPPPPPPKTSGDDFPAPVSYESFPPYAPPASDTASPPISKPSISMSPPAPSSDDDSDSDPGVVDFKYRYKPPAPSGSSFFPTVPPPSKPYGGYSYDKPMTDDAPMETDDNSDDGGYHYEKPAPAKPEFHGYHYKKPAPANPDFYGNHYSKPGPVLDHPPSFDHGSPSHDDYPELIYDHHGGKGGDEGDDDSGNKGADDMKDDDMGMVPPPPPAPDMMKPMKPGMDSPPMDDSGFPHDFPGDLKFHHDFDDHDFYHHHHTTTTTTTTTEMPRVNRYSYYYLGKKLYYLPLYFSVYFIVYVGALIIKAVLRHKIVYPNSYRPNSDTAAFFSKRSVDSWDLSNENLHEITGKVTHAIATAAERYIKNKDTKND